MSTFSRSIFIIKPEAVKYQHDIIQRIKDTGLVIQFTADFIGTEKILDELYGHVPPEARERLNNQMLSKNMVVGVVTGENAVERLVQICGVKTAPAECARGTIRNDYGDHRPDFKHLNAIHRPTTDEEAEDNLGINFLESQERT